MIIVVTYYISSSILIVNIFINKILKRVVNLTKALLNDF